MIKRSVTLIEVMIAMVLTSLVLFTLTFFYQQLGSISFAIDETRQADFKERFIELRLSNILPKTIAPKKDEFPFFSFESDQISYPGCQNLIFYYDNGISIDPLFSNEVIARLMVDKDKRLILALLPSKDKWPKDKSVPLKMEVLLDKVTSLKFSFFVPPKPIQTQTEEQKESLPTKSGKNKDQQSENEPIEPIGNWRNEVWKPEFKALPALIKVEIMTEDTKSAKMNFMYPLVNCSCHIVLIN